MNKYLKDSHVGQNHPIWHPTYTLTPSTASALMQIESARTAVEHTSLPPEAKDVPALITALVEWVHQAEKEGLPAPLIAALVHYQFVTIHPYYDGNGRTARLLATFILHRGGYDLNGFFSLEKHHARDLGAYYNALVVHPHHNYYEGRADADLTGWVEYFIKILAGVFTAAKEEAQHRAGAGEDEQIEPAALRRLDPRARGQCFPSLPGLSE